MNYWTGKRVLVTGGTGFLGRHIGLALAAAGAREVIQVGSRDYDLTFERDVIRLLKETSPDIVFHLAGKVGGNQAHLDTPADFYFQNLMMGTLLMHYCSKGGVQKFVSAIGCCSYPVNAALPLKESDIWEGRPQTESEAYSLAKRNLLVQSEAYFKQYGFKSVTCIPGNVYGEFDNFDLEGGHVIPSLIRKFADAQKTGQQVEVWGDGLATRDFIYAADVAQGMIKAAEFYQKAEVVNLGSGVESSIREVCETLADLTGYTRELHWNPARPQGQARRVLDSAKAKIDLGFSASTPLRDGLGKTLQWFKENESSVNLRK